MIGDSEITGVIACAWKEALNLEVPVVPENHRSPIRCERAIWRMKARAEC